MGNSPWDLLVFAPSTSYLSAFLFEKRNFPPWTAVTLSPFQGWWTWDRNTLPETLASFSLKIRDHTTTTFREWNCFTFTSLIILEAQSLAFRRNITKKIMQWWWQQRSWGKKTHIPHIHIVIHQIHPKIVIMCHPRSMIPNCLSQVLSWPKSSKYHPKISQIWMMVISWCHLQTVATLKDSNPCFTTLLCCACYGAR